MQERKLLRCECGAQVVDTSKERGRFLRRHGGDDPRLRVCWKHRKAAEQEKELLKNE